MRNEETNEQRAENARDREGIDTEVMLERITRHHRDEE